MADTIGEISRAEETFWKNVVLPKVAPLSHDGASGDPATRQLRTAVREARVAAGLEAPEPEPPPSDVGIIVAHPHTAKAYADLLWADDAH